MRKMMIAAALAAFTLTGTAHASSVSGYVLRTAFTGSRVFVWLDGNRDGASCNTPGAGDRYELDGSNALGQTQIAMILTAEGLHKSVLISGTNACPIDTETIGYLQVQP